VPANARDEIILEVFSGTFRSM